MATISTSIRLIDQMSGPLNKMINAVDNLISVVDSAGSAVNNSFNSKKIFDARSAITQAKDEVENLHKSLDNLSDGNHFEKMSTKAMTMGNIIGNVVTSGIRMAVQAGRELINTAMGEYSETMSLSTQLATTLQNMDKENLSSSFDMLEAKADSISKNGMFSKTSMIGAAGELATYFTDSKATSDMMDVLTNYAAGMSNGKAVGNKEMIDYATNLGKIMTGSFDAMSKKGFGFTEAQKAVLKGEATHAQMIEAVGNNYQELTEDMQKVTVVSKVINESWGGMYETMSKTPEGKIAMLQNKFVGLSGTIGQVIYNSIAKITDIINNNWNTIETIMKSITVGINIIMTILTYATQLVIDIASVIINNWSLISPILLGITTALGTYVVYMGLSAAATAIDTIAINLATLAQMGWNAAIKACPVMWLVMAIGLIVGIIILIIQKVAELTGLANSAFGMITGGLNVVIQALLNVGDTISSIISNIGTAFNNVVANVKAMFWGLLETVMEVVSVIAEKLNILPFVEIDTKGLNDKANEFTKKKQEALDSKGEYKDVLASWKTNWFQDSFKSGSAWGDDIANKISTKFKDIKNGGFDINSFINTNQEVATNTAEIADNTATTNDELREYIRDMAEQETINRFTTAEVRVDMGGVFQNVSKDVDADEIVDRLVREVDNGLSVLAEGNYV